MKKLLAIILAAVICIGLCSCALFSKVSAAILYTKAAKALSESEKFGMYCDMTMGVEVLGIGMDFNFKIDMTKAGKDYQMNMNILEQDVIFTYLGDYKYIDSVGQSVKYAVEDSQATEDELMSETMTNQLPELAKEILDATEIIESSDGTKSLTVTLTDEQSYAFMGMAASMYANMTFTDTQLTLHFDKKNEFTGMSVTSKYTASEQGIEMSGDITADYTFTVYDEAPEITLPSDEAKYIDGGAYETADPLM